MQITIKYEASWRNSFLDGSNNEPIPKGGRGFVGSMTSLGDRDEDGKFPNFINRVVSKDTAMGLLNRLIGDQRKLYQARKCPKYFFKGIEDHIIFKDIPDQFGTSSEMVYIRNITGSEDKKSFTGMIKASNPAFNSDYSNFLWSVVFLDIDALSKFVIDENFIAACTIDFDPISIKERFEFLDKLKAVELTNLLQQALDILCKEFGDVEYKIINNKIKPIEIYCSALYLQISRLSQRFDLSGALTKSGLISGISKRGFTPKDFMNYFTTGNKKIVWGNPYLLKERRKGEGEVSSLLTKSSGTLEIQIDIPKDKAKQLEEMIEAAGVSSFYLGKKGLAYVEEITI